jgi:sporulation protein YlmC with PRC-barrel domain
MKRSILRALALCLTTTFVTGYAWAQADNDQGKPGSNSSKSRSSQSGSSQSGANSTGAPGSSSSTYSSGTSYSSQTGQPVRASKLINQSLKGQAGESLGQIQDVVFDPTSGQIEFVVASLSSSATGAPGSSSSTSTGIGTRSTDNSISSPRSAASTTGSYGTTTSGSGKLVAIPWRLLSHSSGDQFTVTTDRTKLETAPTFSSTSWPTMDSAWMQSVYAHFGVSGTSTGAPGSSTGTGTGLGNPSTPGLPSTPGTPDIRPPGSTTPSTTPGTGTGTSGSGTSGSGTSGSGGK